MYLHWLFFFYIFIFFYSAISCELCPLFFTFFSIRIRLFIMKINIRWLEKNNIEKQWILAIHTVNLLRISWFSLRYCRHTNERKRNNTQDMNARRKKTFSWLLSLSFHCCVQLQSKIIWLFMVLRIQCDWTSFWRKKTLIFVECVDKSASSEFVICRWNEKKL